MTTILERGIAEGVVRSLDPFLTAINILGVCTFYFNTHENLKYLVKYLDPTRQLLSAEAIDRQTQAAIDLIWAGIKA
jgi:TetR/AcrR family transcriptional regulator